MSKVSKYAESWNVLKRTKKLTLAITLGSHKRIQQALRDRKRFDKLYQFQLSESNERYEIRYTLSENQRVMYLSLVKISYDVDDL